MGVSQENKQSQMWTLQNKSCLSEIHRGGGGGGGGGGLDSEALTFHHLPSLL